MGTVEPQVAATEPQTQMTDGFQLVIDALKLNGLDTIYGVPGIPITDLTRRAQAAGLRVLSFRHEPDFSRRSRASASRCRRRAS
jgi:oxalyl-CoA decarboxylase